MSTLLRVAALLAALLSLAACNRESRVIQVKPPAIEAEAAPSKSLDVHIYLDASEPMKGFLQDETVKTNYFLETLDKLEGYLGSRGDAKVKSYKFGKGKPEAINSIRDYALGKGAAFRETATFIDEALNHERPKAAGRAQLLVVVTDLFQNRNDVTRLSDKLNENFLSQEGRAVAILGVRNAFKGPIFDIGEKPIPAGGADSLPFYFLLAGETGDVRQALDQINERLKLGAAERFQVVFTRKPVAGPLTRPALLKKEVRQGLIFTPTLLTADREKYSQITLKESVANLPLLDFPDAAATGLTYFKPGNSEVKICKWEKAGCQPTDAASHGVTFNDAKLSVDRARLGEGLFQMEFTLYAKKPDFEELKPWFIGTATETNRIINEKMFEQVKDTRPGRTPNLQQFLQNLGDRLFGSPVPIQRSYVFVMR